MGATQTQSTGLISSFYDADSGAILEDVTAASLDFYQKGAQVDFVLGGKVSFIRITLPNGRIIINSIQKPA